MILYALIFGLPLLLLVLLLVSLRRGFQDRPRTARVYLAVVAAITTVLLLTT